MTSPFEKRLFERYSPGWSQAAADGWKARWLRPGKGIKTAFRDLIDAWSIVRNGLRVALENM